MGYSRSAVLAAWQKHPSLSAAANYLSENAVENVSNSMQLSSGNESAVNNDDDDEQKKKTLLAALLKNVLVDVAGKSGQSSDDVIVLDPPKTQNVTLEDRVVQRALAESQQSTHAGQPTAEEEKLLQLAIEKSKEEEDELQTALALSQIETTDVGTGDSALSSAILRSLQETGPPTNPENRLRAPSDMKAGLLNVGNTCYFNSLLQTYFSLVPIRKQILAFRRNCLSPGTGTRPNSDEMHSVKLMEALQLVFARMQFGNQKWVDPSPVLQALLDSDGNPVKVGYQQDVSEFNELFLRRLRQGISLARGEQPPTPTPPKKAKFSHRDNESHFTVEGADDMVVEASGDVADDNDDRLDYVSNLFTGTLLTEIHAVEANGAPVLSTKKQKFHSLIVRVQSNVEQMGDDGAGDELLGALQREFHTQLDYKSPGGHQQRANARSYLDRLPGILAIEESRVQYKDGIASKCNFPLQCPIRLHLDRFKLDKRPDVDIGWDRWHQLAGDINRLRLLVSKFKLFGGGDGSLSLAECLRKVADYLQSRDAFDAAKMENGDEGIVESHLSASSSICARLGQIELDRLENLEAQLKHLQEAQKTVFQSIENSSHELAAVWIHSGSPGSGHYWAFVRELSTGVWFKFNDREVDRVDQSEVLVDAVGSSTTTKSAYFLFYVDPETVCCDESTINWRAVTPDPIFQQVQTENGKFLEECRRWKSGEVKRFVDQFSTRFHKVRAEALSVRENCDQLIDDSRAIICSSWLLSQASQGTLCPFELCFGLIFEEEWKKQFGFNFSWQSYIQRVLLPPSDVECSEQDQLVFEIIRVATTNGGSPTALDSTLRNLNVAQEHWSRATAELLKNSAVQVDNCDLELVSVRKHFTEFVYWNFQLEGAFSCTLEAQDALNKVLNGSELVFGSSAVKACRLFASQMVFQWAIGNARLVAQGFLAAALVELQLVWHLESVLMRRGGDGGAGERSLLGVMSDHVSKLLEIHSMAQVMAQWAPECDNIAAYLEQCLQKFQRLPVSVSRPVESEVMAFFDSAVGAQPVHAERIKEMEQNAYFWSANEEKALGWWLNPKGEVVDQRKTVIQKLGRVARTVYERASPRDAFHVTGLTSVCQVDDVD